MHIIDGKKIASDITGGLKEKPAPKKFFAAVWIGDDPASESFLAQKKKTARELGVDFRLYRFASEIKNDELRAEVRRIAAHHTCGGIIVQLPLPAHLNAQYALNAIPLEKDADVLGERALGAFYTGRGIVLPPAVGTVQKMLEVENCPPAEALAEERKLEIIRVAVVGLGPLVGKPIAIWLMRKTRDLYLLRRGSDFSILKNADLVVTGTGVPGLIQPAMLKDGAGVIDFGYAPQKAAAQIDTETQIRADKKIKLMGDFDAERLATSDARLAFYTPTPGGTGPILVAKLFENFYTLNNPKRYLIRVDERQGG